MPDEKLSDNDVHALLCAASDALGGQDAQTTHGQSALETARRALLLLQFALVKAGDDYLPPSTEA